MAQQQQIPKFIQNILSASDLEHIAQTVSEIEKKTSGEVRVSIREKRERLEKKLDLMTLAAKEFHKLKMHETKDATGVLLFFLFQERKFQILADTGIYKKVPQSTWDNIARDISTKFKEGKFGDGICSGIREVGNQLAEHFPVAPDDTNELSNEVSFS